MNNCRELAKQFFKLIPLSMLIDFTLNVPHILNFKYSFFINIVYKLVYKVNFKFEDTDILKKMYVLFKIYILTLQDEENVALSSLRKKQKFLLMLTENKHQYIMLRYLKVLQKIITIDKDLFLRIIYNRMYLFIADFAKHP